MEEDRLVNRKFYVTINSTRESFYPRTTACCTKEGELVTDERRKTKSWREFFSKYLINNNKDNNNSNKGGCIGRINMNGDDVVKK